MVNADPSFYQKFALHMTVRLIKWSDQASYFKKISLQACGTSIKPSLPVLAWHVFERRLCHPRSHHLSGTFQYSGWMSVEARQRQRPQYQVK